MLVTRQKILRRFWYPVLPVSRLADGPQPFTLLGERLVLWTDAAGQPAALADRCCHRTAQLSKGWVGEQGLVCGYHGWTFDGQGRCVRIPQSEGRQVPASACVPAYACSERYGYVWVCLDEPLDAIPEFPEAQDPAFRQIDEFYEPWRCAGLRVMENSFDNAHFSFVHRSSFGRYEDPLPASLRIEPFDSGFHMFTEVPVKNPEIQKKLLGTARDETVRYMDSTWYRPFCRRLRIRYPEGLVHTIITCATPTDDQHSMIVQFAYRNDSEKDAPTADIIAFDRLVTEEDRQILESTEFDVPLDPARKREVNMPSDRPGVLMRRMLLDLLHAHGETEIHSGLLTEREEQFPGRPACR